MKTKLKTWESTKTIGVAKATPQLKEKMKNKMKNTIELIELMNKTLVDVIQFLDSKGHSNTEVRSSVDKLLNHQQGLKKDVEQEIKKVVGVN